MSAGYTWVQWSPHKRRYDLIMVGAVAAYLSVFFAVSKLLFRGENAYSDEVVLLRATGSCAFVLLHVILCIGPLSRLDRRFLPVLYNRRHLGVLTFLISLVHGVVSIGYYHGFGVLGPLESLLATNTSYASLRSLPYQPLGVTSLITLFLLAATSHDFWLKNLGPTAWKRLHMLAYGAYVQLVGHVALGALQNDRGAGAAALVGFGVFLVAGLHIAAGIREVRRDAGTTATPESDGLWIDVGTIDEIPENRARTVCTASGERIAVFKHEAGVSAVTNVCAHQGGPLGEGKVIDGCITCPWHGWQYRPGDGCAPPPFVEKIATHEVRISAGRVQVSAKANPPGTPTTPARATASAAEAPHA
ncbi:MAG: ferric reductase-like transmembrane domain-containing protein [Phycisphaerales bacterium]|nr:ferric reductase-like transmembrane domain-containing protein [Phycisphaerales bacterium]